MLEKLKAKIFPKFKPNSFSVGMPAHLKDPKNYTKIQKALLECLAGAHTHSELQHWAACVTCQSKVQNLKIMMKALGFRSHAQYLFWKKTHELLITDKRVKLR